MTKNIEVNQDRVEELFSKLGRLLSAKKNASYQFIVLESILKGIEEEPTSNQVTLEYIFYRFAEIAYVLRKQYKLDLGGDKQSVEGKTSANGIIDRFVEKYDLQNTNELDREQIKLLSSAIMASSIKKWPIDGITSEKIGLFKKESIGGKECISMSEQVKQILRSNISQAREQNDHAIINYLKTIPHNTINEVVHISGLVGIEDVSKKEISTWEGEVKSMKLYKEDELIQHIHTYITSKGFSYSLQTIQNIYLSLKTKPFTILAGVSGTGKSKIIELFAEAIGASVENGRFKLIAVRPDWSDSTELLGYRDLNNHFNPGILTQLIVEASNNLDMPYFVCLDEMNLARVEYYLSDFLSIIESRKWKDEKIVTHPLLHESAVGEDEVAREKYGVLCIPENVYIVGTVNMDETTYPFSKKVLDRANTIEFSEVNLLDGLEELEEDRVSPLEDVDNRYMKSTYLNLMDCKAHKEVARKVVEELVEVNKILELCQLHFAYRVRDEIVFYMLYNNQFELMSYEEAFELQLLQKILPRITGSSGKVLQVLQALQGYTEQRYPKAYQKIQFMIERYEEDGFTSYWM